MPIANCLPGFSLTAFTFMWLRIRFPFNHRRLKSKQQRKHRTPKNKLEKLSSDKFYVIVDSRGVLLKKFRNAIYLAKKWQSFLVLYPHFFQSEYFPERK